ncbi:MAG: sulfotransferase [Candidatus Peregrinibacteria bacterium]|nr:sulfotransferase [Candidatus Peregrinibacteria bacterium]
MKFKILKKLYSLFSQRNKEKIKFLKYYLGIGLNKYAGDAVGKNPSKTIIILGMHRSGTSVISKIIYSLDVDLGKHLIEPSHDNKEGFYENRDIVRLNNYLLAKAGGMWHSPPSKENIIKLRGNKSIEKVIKKVILRNQNDLWGFKDPRTSLTLRLLIPFIKNPYFIICYRDKNSVAKSLYKREGISIKRGLFLWNIYNNSIKKFIKENNKIPSLEINFEKLIENEKRETERIKKFLGIKKQTGKFVNKKLIHN